MPIYRDCTLHELMVLFVLCLMVCVALGMLLLGLVAGQVLLGACIGVPVSFLGIPVAAKRLQQAKVGKPLGYYTQRLALWLEAKQLYSTPFLIRQGIWSINDDKRN